MPDAEDDPKGPPPNTRTLLWKHNDRLRGPKLLPAELLAQSFDPYGSPNQRAGAELATYGWAGEQADANGLIYLRARFYAPGMGRFVNTDPSRMEMNPYQYAASNPVLHTVHPV